MEIRQTVTEDLERVMELYAMARKFMQESGNPDQWGQNHPPRAMIVDDIAAGRSYVCVTEDDGTIVGVFYYAQEDDKTYARIYEGQWLNDEPYAVVHRIAAPTGRKGVAGFCLAWCFEKSGGNLKIDTHRNNAPMHHMLVKNGFTRCGMIYLEDGDERIAYQKNGGINQTNVL